MNDFSSTGTMQTTALATRSLQGGARMAISGLYRGNAYEMHVTQIDVGHHGAKDIPSGSLAV